MDFGFGTAGFGATAFGTVEQARDVIYDRTIPLQQQSDDEELANFDLRDTLYAIAGVFDELYRKSEYVPFLVDPSTSLSGQEHQVSLVIDSVEDLGGNVQRVTVSLSNDADLLDMFPQSMSSDGTRRDDGWVAVIDDAFFNIRAVDSFNRTIDVFTGRSIGSKLDVRPPDILSLLGDDLGLLVDRADPPDYTRRALWRAPLIKALKVSKRLFSLVGKLYGFDVDLQVPYCISEEIYNNLLITNPQETYKFNIDGVDKFFTTIDPKAFRYDKLKADVIMADRKEPLELPTTFSTPVQDSNGFYCIRIDEAAWLVFNAGNGSGFQFIDEDGDVYFVEKDYFPEEETVPVAGPTELLNGTYGSMGRVRSGSVSIEFTTTGGVTLTYTDNGDGTFNNPVTGLPTTGSLDYDTGAFSSLLIENIQPGSDLVIRGQGPGLCVLGPKGGSEPEPPTGTNGTLVILLTLACSADYRRASMYIIDVSPNEVLSESGANLNRLIDRTIEKINAFIPMHIRVVETSYVLTPVTNQPSVGPNSSIVSSLTVLMESLSVDFLSGPLFDRVIADVQPVDQGAWRISSSLTIEI